MSNFRPVDRETGFLLPPSVEEWLPERHLARFVVEVIEQLDLSAFVKAYRGDRALRHGVAAALDDSPLTGTDAADHRGGARLAGRSGLPQGQGPRLSA